jgi:hypothetical protein
MPEEKSITETLSGFANPLLAILPFTKAKGFDVIREVMVKTKENVGFTDAGFQAMLKQVGWRGGEAWCAYFVKLIYMQFYSFDRDWLSKNFTGSAMGNFYAVERLNRMNDKRYIVIKKDEPQVADILCWGAAKGHTGIVTKVINKNLVETIEGNTGVRVKQGDGKLIREGDGSSTQRRFVRVGAGSGYEAFRGYIRRNFTPQELSKLYFDEQEQTMKFKK